MDKSGLSFAFPALRPWCLLVKVLADYRFTRLVTVILVAQRMLLPHLAGISIS
jgi:hypothetical protein